MHIKAHPLILGTATGPLLFSDTSLSFWGGVDSSTGQILDAHHPLRGEHVTGHILAVPSSRGSSSGSSVMLELLLNHAAPAGLVFHEYECIITLGVIVAQVIFGIEIPVLVLEKRDDFEMLRGRKYAAIEGDEVRVSEVDVPSPEPVRHANPGVDSISGHLDLTARDRWILEGKEGDAAKVALEILLRFATIQGAKSLLDVSQAHIDACIYIGPASLRFARSLLAIGAKCVVPTTLNAISIDRRRWSEIGMHPTLASQAGDLADCYVKMGARPSFTCAPYTLESVPGAGEDIGWAESNAVVFANSVLGARTQKYPDFVDVCIALTGRAPAAGCHLEEGRRPRLLVEVQDIKAFEDDGYPLLGYLVGKLAQNLVPLVCGMEHLQPSMAELKAMCAAFGTTASAAMFHIRGVTPEGDRFRDLQAQLPLVKVNQEDLVRCWHELNTAKDSSVGLVSLGNPHFTLEEFATLANLCRGRTKSSHTSVIVTTSRDTYENVAKAGYLDSLEAFGATVLTDTCWCMIGEPVIAGDVRNIMTNSAKYAHYAPGMVNRGVHFGSLAQCVDAACTGYFEEKP